LLSDRVFEYFNSEVTNLALMAKGEYRVPPMSTGEGLNLQDYVRILRQRKWVVALFVVLAVLASIGYCKLQKAQYTGTAQLLLTPQLSTTILDATDPSANASSATSNVDVPTDTQVIESTAVEESAARTVSHPPKVAVSEVGITDVVTVSTTSTDPKVAAAAANAYAHAYLAVQQSQSVTSLTSASKLVSSHIASVASEITRLDQQIAATTGPAAVALESQIPSLESQLSTYQEELAQYNFYASLNTGGGQVITPAKVPTSPSSPKTAEDAVIAGFLGLLIGVGVALLREYFDDRIRTKQELDGIFKGIATLGTIPLIPDWKEKKDAVLVTIGEPHSSAAEAYRSLRTAIQFVGMDRPTRLVQFTSPTAADGKTTTLANTAVTLSQAGLRVVVVCCDLRRPRVHEFFGLKNDIGFTSVLLGDTPLEEALQQVPDCPGLHLLASGPKPPNPSELLGNPRTRKLLESLADLSDIVLIDSPPLLPVTDPTVLAGVVDAVVLVVSMGTSTKSGVVAALENLGRVNAPLVGVVLNRVPQTDSYTYYRYTYGEPVAALSRDES
jgi:polysaccharide biosynthesis transport protein